MILIMATEWSMKNKDLALRHRPCGCVHWAVQKSRHSASSCQGLAWYLFFEVLFEDQLYHHASFVGLFSHASKQLKWIQMTCPCSFLFRQCQMKKGSGLLVDVIGSRTRGTFVAVIWKAWAVAPAQYQLHERSRKIWAKCSSFTNLKGICRDSFF